MVGLTNSLAFGLVGGIVIGCGFGVFEFVNTPGMPILVKLVVGVIYLGLTLLLISVFRQRVIERRTDKYKNVDI